MNDISHFVYVLNFVDKYFPKTDSNLGFNKVFIDKIFNIDYTKLDFPTKDDFFTNFVDESTTDLTSINNYEFTIKNFLKNKPYYLLYDCPDFYIGKEYFGNVWFICYKEVMMIDCDIDKLNDSDSDTDNVKIQNYLIFLQNYCKKTENVDKLFMIYRTRRGLHAFLVSHRTDFNKMETLETMFELKSDPIQSAFAYFRGWCCRLNKKDRSDMDNVCEFVSYVGTGKAIPELEKIVKFHSSIIPFFKDDLCDLSRRFAE